MENSNEKCIQCDEEIKGTAYENYYCRHEYLCAEWNCWAEWMSENTHEAGTY